MPDDRNSENEPKEIVLTGMAYEIVLLWTKRLVALLPASHIPLPWLRELVMAEPVMLELTSLHRKPMGDRSWDFLVRQLETSVLAKVDNGSSVRSLSRNASLAMSSMDDEEIAATRRRLRSFCAKRLETIRAEEQRVINGVMTGDPDIVVTAWTVPPIAEVRARAAADARVEVVDFGHGQYSVRIKPSEAWEMDCLKAFVAQEFTRHDLSGVEWALRTHLLTYEELDAKKEQVGEAYLQSPDSDESWIVSGLYWLSMARKWSGNGWGSRGAWQLSGKAVEILNSLVERSPNNTRAAELLAEVTKLHWLYDD